MSDTKSPTDVTPAGRTRVEIRRQPSDFQVDELPAYEPVGQGEHLYVHFRKTGLDTMTAATQLARRLGVPGRDVGTAGLKDRHAVTTQSASFPWPMKNELPDAARLSGEGIEVLSLARHNNKLRTGHLRGNRFTLVLRGLRPEERAPLQAALERLGTAGLPNRFGVQRFGRDGNNADQARAWLAGKQPAPRHPRVRRLQFSALQSEIFHRVLDRRIADGTWDRLLEGDLLQAPGGGKMLRSSQMADAAEAVAAWRLSPTGPIYGARMPWPEGAAKLLEDEVLATGLADRALIDKNRQLGEGARRPLGLRPEELRVRELVADATGLQVEFVLPKGAYATTVLEAVCEVDDVSRRGATDREAGTIEEDSEEGPENER
ncbi:MAG: tRNA pseudouridine(13) synthase TruD [Myxococcales bacterium]|nr:MAG: tRNA pseudouridine(13) synthase TruD [Myxococcales bacterium]